MPPTQAEMMVDALCRPRGSRSPTWPSRASSTGSARPPPSRALEAELYFYGQVFGFDPVGVTDAVELT